MIKTMTTGSVGYILNVLEEQSSSGPIAWSDLSGLIYLVRFMQA